MPRTGLPPTPASSTDIKGQDGAKQLATLQMSFELPPPAMTSSEAAQAANHGLQPSPPVSEKSQQQTSSPKSSFPVQASETVKSRRRSSAAQTAVKDQFALPPPPTRSRKIIQMKPRQEEAPAEATAGPKTAAAAVAKTNTQATPVVTAPPTTTPAKRKQPSATSAAGRKAARKTAHSLIERRRRSKMNEEFAVLKSMIPACTGEMHKLAILQASIEYVRYLEDCISTLKAQREANPATTPKEHSFPTPSGREPYNPERHYGAYREDNAGDVEMTGSEMPSPTFTANQGGRSQQPSISPALLAEDSRHRHDSYSSASTEHHRHYSYSASATTSPAFGPQVYGYAQSSHSASASTLTSPALLPQRDLDQEATAALLMLNNDRRGTQVNAAGRGMSVRDLLST